MIRWFIHEVFWVKVWICLYGQLTLGLVKFTIWVYVHCYSKSRQYVGVFFCMSIKKIMGCVKCVFEDDFGYYDSYQFYADWLIDLSGIKRHDSRGWWSSEEEAAWIKAILAWSDRMGPFGGIWAAMDACPIPTKSATFLRLCFMLQGVGQICSSLNI